MTLKPVAYSKPSAWPFYVVCDVSNSMWRTDKRTRPTPWEVIEAGVLRILDEIDRDATARDICQISIVAFGESVATLLPLTPFLDDGLDVKPMPQQGWTDYAAAFAYLRDQVKKDYERLSSTHKPKRPVIYFITDGRPEVRGETQPETTWQPPLEALKDLSSAPIVVALGLGSTLRSTIQAIPSRSGVGCVAQAGIDAGQLLGAILNSIITSVTFSASNDDFTFEIPDGMVRV